MNTNDDQQVKQLEAEVCELEEIRKHDHLKICFDFNCLESIVSNDSKVAFYTGFPSYDHLKICFDFLDPAASQLIYRDSRKVLDHSNKGLPLSLPPMEEFFLTLVRLRLGLLEQDIAYCFGISQSTVSRIFTSWINFMHNRYLYDLQESLFVATCQLSLNESIHDATEVSIQQPSLPELQQRMFSSYKNHNTFKALIGISPSDAVMFVSKLYPGNNLTKSSLVKVAF